MYLLFLSRVVNPLAQRLQQRFHLSRVGLVGYSERVMAVYIVLIAMVMGAGFAFSPVDFNQEGHIEQMLFLVMGSFVWAGHRWWCAEQILRRGRFSFQYARWVWGLQLLVNMRFRDWRMTPVYLVCGGIICGQSAALVFVAWSFPGLVIAGLMFFYGFGMLFIAVIAGFWQDPEIKRLFPPPSDLF